MNWNINWKKILRISIRTMLIGAFLLSVGFTDSRQNEMKCGKVIVNVKDAWGESFIESPEIFQLIHDKFGELEGKQLHSINISLLEKIIANNPFVARVEVFSTIDGKLRIEVVQRHPVVRIINFRHESFYIDDQGIFMPLSEKYTARVPVANGYLFDTEAEKNVRLFSNEDLKDTSVHVSVLEQIYRVADYMRHEDFWNAQIEQIYVNAQGELELVPRVGNHTINFGTDLEISSKFDKLMLFYKEGLNKTGWNTYSYINLKFKDQVVCTKNK